MNELFSMNELSGLVRTVPLTWGKIAWCTSQVYERKGDARLS